MSKNLQKILVILLLAIIFISNSSSIIKAVYEITDAYIVQIGEAPYHLKYYNESKGIYTYAVCSIVGHYQDGTFYPAYCLNRDLNGVGKVESYTVDVDSLISDNRVWRAVKNGYPYKSASEMGLSSDFDAFAVTKFAIYCLTGQADINLYIADNEDTEAQAMLSALHNLVNIGQNGTDTFSSELKIVKAGDLVEDGDYYSITYKVNAGSTISSYTIKSVSGLLEGDLVTDVNGNIKTTFSSGEKFKVKLLKTNLNSDKDINININAELKNYPMFYGKTRISGTQNYLLTANSYQNVETSINTKLKLNKGKLKVYKIDSETKKPIENTTFELYNANNDLLETKTTDSKGEVEFTNLYQGNYVIKEKEANDKYVLIENFSRNVYVEYNKEEKLTIENEPKKGNLTIYKVDKDNSKITLGNVGFELYNEDKDLIGTYYTDSNGKIEINNLRIGKYLIREISTNEWYNLAEDTELEIKWNETTTKTIENELKKSQIKIIKVDKDNNEIKIPNVVFEIQDTDGNILETITTNENGEAYTKQYPVRDYEKLMIHEIETDTWYKINDELTEVKLEENKTKTVIIENEMKKGQIRVIKVDADNYEVKLAGVKFNILDENNNIVETIETDENGEAISKLLPIDKKYIIQETLTQENYVLSEESKTVTLDENQITNVTFENEKKKGQIRVIKVDTENNEVRLSNVEFNVLDEEENIVDTLITDENGEALSKKLSIDKKYILQETKTNEKYVLSEETKKVTLTENQITDITFENEKIKGTIQVIKTTADSSEFSGIEKGVPLEGVEFEIYDINGKIVDTIITNSEGKAKSKKLEKGTYKVKEISTNKWYILDENYYTLEIKTNNETLTLNLENKPSNPDEEIQKTGPDTAKAEDKIEYKINIKNIGNVALENFIWEDEIPTNYIKVTKINLGTYNQQIKYDLYYRTNFSDDYILFLEDISTTQNEEIDFTKELSDNEYVTNIKIDFGKVDVGFETKEETIIHATVNSNVKRDDVFENKVTLTSKYNEYNLTKNSSWKTKIYKILPVTGK